MSNPAAITQNLDIVESYEKADFADSYQERVGNKVLAGYLSPDAMPSNPLEDSDGIGSIFSAHRHSSSFDEMQNALALDRDWSPDLELVDEHPTYVRDAWVRAATDSFEFQQWCQEHGRVPKYADSVELAAYYKRKAERFWRETGGVESNYHHKETIEGFDVTDDVREEVWKELFGLYLIGNPDRVSLDVYQHSGTAYSVSGEGMQCNWDTSSGAAVWVPDDCAREEITRRAEVYKHGEVVPGIRRGLPAFSFKLDCSPKVSGFWYKHWFEAFSALAKTSKLKKNGNLNVGRRRAAIEMARSAAELYTDYCNGSVYGVVIETFEITDENIGGTTSIEEDSCWGYYGTSHAESELKALFQEALKRLEQNA
jgi:hypothetical protein